MNPTNRLMRQVAQIAARFVVAALLALSACQAGVIDGPCPGGNCPTPEGNAGNGASVVPRQGVAAHPAVVRIVNQQGNGRSLGSGALIDKNSEHGLILTCAHLFREGVGSVTVVFPDNHQYGARVLKLDREWDLAALLIRIPKAEPVAVASDAPRIGTTLRTCGYGPRGLFQINVGRALKYVALGGTRTNEAIEVSGSARQGDSGGPMFDDRGQLVGVIMGTNGRMVIGPCCLRIHKFLNGLSPRFRQHKKPSIGPRKATPERNERKKAPNEIEGAPIERAPTEEKPVEGVPTQEKPKEVSPDRSVLRAIGDLRTGLESLRSEVKQRESVLAQQTKEMGDRVRRVGEAADTLAGRLDTTERILSEGNLRKLIAGAVASKASASGSDWLSLLAPVLLGALGISAPPLAVVLGWKLLRAWRKRRRRKNRKRRRSEVKEDSDGWQQSARDGPKASPGPQVSTRQLNDEYAEQLHGVFSQSGRSPAQDATLGREYDEAIANATKSSDPTLADWARKLQDQVERKFLRIHGWSPSPAEPLNE